MPISVCDDTTIPCLETKQADTTENRKRASRVEYETARDFVKLGLAEWLCLKRGRYAIKMLRSASPQAMDVRGPSCRMGPRVMEANADDQRWAQVVTAIWQQNWLGLAPRVAM